MMNTSQTIDEVKREHGKKLEQLAIDAPLGGKAKQLFENAKAPLDPRIYKGDFKSYRADGQSYETGNQALNRMSKNSGNVKDWLGNERYDAERQLPQSRRGYKFGRDTASSFEDVAKQYLMGEGKELYAHLRSQGRGFYDITRIGTADLEGAIAALAIKGTEAALLGSKDFYQKVSQLASQYGVSNDRAVKYVLAHEFTHASQKGKYFDDPVLAELDVENTLKDYFSKKGDKDLAAIAGDRAANVTGNYGSLGTYRMPKGVGKAGYSSSVNGRASYSGAGKAGSYAAN
jgi:hypothetical protein